MQLCFCLFGFALGDYKKHVVLSGLLWIRIFVLLLYYLVMTKQTFYEKADELIEMIWNFRAAQGWMENKDYFEYEIRKRVEELMYPWFD